MLSFVPVIVLAGIWTSVESKLIEFCYSLPEGFGETRLSFHVSEGQLTDILAFYNGRTVKADAQDVDNVAIPAWDSLNVTFEDIDDDGVIETFAFCFYEGSELNSDKPQRYITYSLYAEKFYKEIIESTDLVRRCEPKKIEINRVD